jgi:hypothetical protein
MIWANPKTFFLLTALIVAAAWLLMNFSYSTILANKNSQIELQDRQIAEYKSKLGGATPDQAKARIDDLEKRLTQLAIRVEPRFLTPEQRGTVFKIAAVPPGSQNAITMVHEGGCVDCPGYAADFEEVLRSAGWSVGNGVVTGPARRPLLGLALRVSNVQNLTPQESSLKAALEAAKISFNLMDGAYQGTELFFTALRK